MLYVGDGHGLFWQSLPANCEKEIRKKFLDGEMSKEELARNYEIDAVYVDEILIKLLSKKDIIDIRIKYVLHYC